MACLRAVSTPVNSTCAETGAEIEIAGCPVTLNGIVKLGFSRITPFQHGVDSRRFAWLRRRKQYIDCARAHRRRCRGAQFPPPSHRLQVVGATDQTAQRHAILQQLTIFLKAGLDPSLVHARMLRVSRTSHPHAE